jgi:GT2 family glycosyltransferase
MVSVVIPVFNKIELTTRCLLAVWMNSTRVKEVCVVDNASTDETPSILKSFQQQFTQKGITFNVVSNHQNLGFGSACNQGIRISTGSVIAILNNDTWLMHGWDQALLDELNKRDLDEVGPFFDERPLSDQPQRTAEEFLVKNRNKFRKHFVPILMFFKREAVERLKFDHGGIFDERFFVTYEDTDLIHRMKQLGMKYGQTSNCYIWHHSMGTRSTPGLLPSGYEADGLKRFIDKWGFDPRDQDHTLVQRWKRKYRKKRAEKGMF